MRDELILSDSDNEHAPDEPISLPMECDMMMSITPKSMNHIPPH